MKLLTYIEDSFKELKDHVTWPTWKELQKNALLVLVASLIISLIIFLMDYTFGTNATGFRGVLGSIYDLMIGN